MSLRVASARLRNRLGLSLLSIATGLTCVMPSVAASPQDDCGLTSAQRENTISLAKAMVERNHAPGFVIDIRCNGRPWLLQAGGLADVARTRGMRQDDLFRIYSMTKPLTSLAVLMLAEDGLLSVDDAVERYLPEFSSTPVFAGGEDSPPKTLPAARKLTVRDLLRHSAGIGYISPAPDPISKLYVQRGIDHGGGGRIEPTDGTPMVDSVAELTRRIASIPMRHQPGSRFTYGNSTDVLGHLVAVVSGKPLREFLGERLLKPLGMTDTSFVVPVERVARLTAAYAAPSQIASKGEILRKGSLAQLPAGRFGLADDPTASVFSKQRTIDFGGAGLVSTAADYQAFLQMMLNGGKAHDKRLVRRETLVPMVHNQLDAKAIDNSGLGPQGLGFGLGFAVVVDPERSPGGVPSGIYFWGGAASTNFWVDPGRGITGVLMTQVFGGDVQPYFVEMLEMLYAKAKN
jgi:CubicO group peptidase (beta-lactamase class C family)